MDDVLNCDHSNTNQTFEHLNHTEDR